MNLPLPIRVSSLLSSLIASLTALALLVAPICAPLCAARACTSNAGTDRCHDMAGMNSDRGNQIGTVRKTCGAVELSAVLVKPDDRSASPRFFSAESVPIFLDATSAQRFPAFGTQQNSARWPVMLSASAESRLAGVLLRI